MKFYKCIINTDKLLNDDLWNNFYSKIGLFNLKTHILDDFGKLRDFIVTQNKIKNYQKEYRHLVFKFSMRKFKKVIKNFKNVNYLIIIHHKGFKEQPEIKTNNAKLFQCYVNDPDDRFFDLRCFSKRYAEENGLEAPKFKKIEDKHSYSYIGYAYVNSPIPENNFDIVIEEYYGF